MNAHALTVLEFAPVLDLVAQRASSELGAARVRALTPERDRGRIDAEHGRVVAMRALAESDRGWRTEPIPSVEAPLARLRAAGGRWSGEELLRGAELLRSSRLTRDALGDEGYPAVAREVLHPFATRLLSEQSAERSIDKAIDPDGAVRDAASPALRRLRRELRGAQSELVQLLEKAMAALPASARVPDASVTIRNGRYVIPVRRDGRAGVGGIVHDESATRGTVFVEPPAAVEFGNHIREIEAEEEREVERILGELTEMLRPLRDGMIDALDALVTLDTLAARARFASDFDCHAAAFAPAREGFAVRRGRHPLLAATNADVVPFDLELGPSERTLLLSGPNTGGKTVLLKALGLLSAMAQSGIPPTVGENSRIAICDDCFADIGDEQSIQASLSTFSAHVARLAEILDGATADSLVLIDELGSGTDPAEGAALGAAILEDLAARGTLTVATTHLGALKLLATEVPGVVNASLQFDEEALAPTYRLLKGLPGRSYGLQIARRLRLSDPVLARAEERASTGERDVAALLSDLERRQAVLSQREEDAQDALERASDKLSRIEERERRMREAERSFERRMHQDARRVLLDARAEVDRVIRGLRSASEGEVLRDARREVEALAAEHGAAIEEIDQAESAAEAPREEAAIVSPGDEVQVEAFGGRPGRVVETRGDDAVVAVGAIKVTVPRTTLKRARPKARDPEDLVPAPVQVPDPDARSEVDLRGLRVDEIERALLASLDQAIRADLSSFRIIHGKGTGALRERVREILRSDKRVRSYRLGSWNEGGSGVTIAELR
ncbi:MAG TPA: endonuclease MutS2 [Gemmatimonadaceae bacterium]|nr:endonuclease MutS2 [Gemmatimonadaceae bacterium]